jgi:hypothetical protein
VRTHQQPGEDPIFGNKAQEALEAIPDHLNPLEVVQFLKRRLVPDLARRIATLHHLRTRSRAKFPTLALPFLTEKGLQQSSGEFVARERARRIGIITPDASILDATCGIGGDLVALAVAGSEVVGADRDAECASFARANLEHNRVRARVVIADAARPAVRSDLVLLDPDRRAEGNRTLDPRRWSPDLEKTLRVASRFEGGCSKLAPGLDIDVLCAAESAALPARIPRCHEWISRGGELVELCLWTGSLAGDRPPPRRATRLERTGEVHTIEGEVELQPALDSGSAAEVRWIADPDPAVIRSGLLGNLARRSALFPLAPKIAFLGGEERVDSPFLRYWRVLRSCPVDTRKIRKLLREHDIGPVTVVKRGHPDPPELLERRFRGKGSKRGHLLLARLDHGHRAYLVEPG